MITEIYQVQINIGGRSWWPVFTSPNHDTIEEARERLAKGRKHAVEDEYYRIVKVVSTVEILND